MHNKQTKKYKYKNHEPAAPFAALVRGRERDFEPRSGRAMHQIYQKTGCEIFMEHAIDTLWPMSRHPYHKWI
jgi:hypothetical protein